MNCGILSIQPYTTFISSTCSSNPILNITDPGSEQVFVNMKIYNRWGKLVFKTENPDILWDGKDIDSKKPVTDGVYYYICDVYERRLTGIEPRAITGFIHIFRTKKSNNE